MPEQPYHHRPNQHGLLRRLGRRVFSARRRRHAIFFIALAAGVTVFLPALVIVPPFAVVLGAIALFVVYLTLVGIALPALDAEFLRAKAAEADAPVGFIFAVVVAVVAICCVSLFKALNGEGTPAAIEVGLSIVSVLLGWFTIHTMAAMHYAYEYYEPLPGSDDAQPSTGLAFPDNDEPDGVDFLYFAYAVGVAFAVSDVQVQSRKMRRFVLIHSTFAYFFNTLIVAATVNVAVAVGS